MDNNTGRIVRVSGPVVIAEDVNNAKMYDVVRVGKMGLCHPLPLETESL